MKSKNIRLASLIWIVFVDSMGWGIAFSIFATLFFNEQNSLLPNTISNSTKYMIYESLLAVYSMFMFFFAPLLGSIADRYGRKPGLEISMLGLTLGFILNALGCYYSNIWILFFGRIISGATAGSLSIAQAAAIDISTSKTKSFYLSILMMANCLGFSLGPVIGGLFMSLPQLPVINGAMTFLISALMSFIGFLSIRFFFKETRNVDANKSPMNFLNEFLNIKVAFCKPIVTNYLSALLFTMVAFGLFFSDLPVFLNRQFSTESSTTGFILSIEAIIFSITLMFGGKYILSKFDKLSFVMATQIIQLIAYIAMSFSRNSLVFYISFFTVVSAFAGLMYIGLLTLISDATDKDWQGRIMGVVAALSSVTWGIGPLLTGYLNHYEANIAFMCCALITMMGIYAILILKKNSKESRNLNTDKKSQTLSVTE